MAIDKQLPNIGRIGIPAQCPQDYTIWAYVVGDIEYEEAHSILVNKYKFGPGGAKESLTFAKKYPHMARKPGDYEKIVPHGLWSDYAEQYGGR